VPCPKIISIFEANETTLQFDKEYAKSLLALYLRKEEEKISFLTEFPIS